jgi:hypothetical protein
MEKYRVNAITINSSFGLRSCVVGCLRAFDVVAAMVAAADRAWQREKREDHLLQCSMAMSGNCRVAYLLVLKYI